MFTYNTTVHKTTRYIPYELLYGRKAHLPSSITRDPEFHYTYDDYVRSLQYKLNTSFKYARENIIESKRTNKRYYDRNNKPGEFKVNDLVKLKNV